MSILLWPVALFLIVATGLHVLTSGAVLLRSWRDRRPRPALEDTPPVSVVRTVTGLENNIEATLRSGFTLTYPNYELIFCTQSAADPVIPLVEQLRAEYPHVASKLLVGDNRISINPKLNNLVKGWAAAQHDLVCMTDSNVLMPPDYLQRLLSRWAPNVGMVCSPAYGAWPEGAAAELECAFLNTYEARWQLAADTIGLGFAQGKTMLWRRDVLDKAGGIAALASEPAEDAASTKIVREAGLKVRLSHLPFAQPLGPRTFKEVWRRQVRWARLRRVTFKAFFAGELFSGGFLPFLAAAAILFASGFSLLWLVPFIALWYALEAAVAAYARWPLGPRDAVLWVVRDFLIPALWVSAWTGTKFTWRGVAMDVAGEDAKVPTETAFTRLKPFFDRVRARLAREFSSR
jgi:ceramide glucosyltransferase